jgi:large conductance mechanosensitive channel
MSFVSEFREFAMRGNVIDLAVGVVIGGAFGKIVSSVVADVIMPPIGLALGGVNFSHLKLILKEAVDDKTPSVTLNYGSFLQSCVDFMIIAFAIFMLVKLINSLKREEAAAPTEPAPPPAQEILLGEIRDLLKARQ